MRIYRKTIEAELLLMVKIDEKESGGSEKSERKKPFLRFIGFGKHSTIFHVLSFTRSLSVCALMLIFVLMMTIEMKN